VTRRRASRWVGSLVLLLALHGCMTAGLWGFDVTSERDPITREEQTSLEAREGEELGSVWLRLLATPFTLVLDCLTLPIQAWVFGWDDDEDESRSQRDADTWRSTHRDRND
jgi:uncharacterized protein YceK